MKNRDFQSGWVYNIVLPICLLFLLCLGGCGNSDENSKPDSRPYLPEDDPLVNPGWVFTAAPADLCRIDAGATLYLRLPTNINTLNPLFVSNMSEFTIVDALYRGLFVIDRNMTWRVNEDLVEFFSESQDHRRFRIKLKPGITWSDGKAFTAYDVEFSWRQILDPQVPCYSQKHSTRLITQCKALDKYNLVFRQEKPLATRRLNLLFPIIPRHLFQQDKQQHPDLITGDYYQQLSHNPVGNGPWRLLEWQKQQRIILERRRDYPGRKPYCKRIVFRIIPDKNISLLQFAKGQVDVVERLGPRQFARDINPDHFGRIAVKLWHPSGRYIYIGYNMDGSNAFFTDAKVRKAMTCALNIPRIIEKVYYNLAQPCRGIFAPSSWAYNPDISLISYNLEQAELLLQSAGWEIDPQDGYRYKIINGRKCKFEFTLTFSNDFGVGLQIAGIFQADLRKLGIVMKTRMLERTTFWAQLRRHKFQAMLSQWTRGADPDKFRNVWVSDGYHNGRNYIGYSRPRVDELFRLGLQEFDREKRQKIYREIQQIIYDDQPYTWIVYEPTLAIINRKIRGVQFGTRGIMNFYPGYCNWWVPRKE